MCARRWRFALTDRCDIQKRRYSIGAVGEREAVFQTINSDVPCRFITSLLDTRVQLEPIAGAVVVELERYRVAFAHDVVIPSAGRLVRGQHVFEIVNIREGKTDDAQAMVFVTRVRDDV